MPCLACISLYIAIERLTCLLHASLTFSMAFSSVSAPSPVWTTPASWANCRKSWPPHKSVSRSFCCLSFTPIESPIDLYDYTKDRIVRGILLGLALVLMVSQLWLELGQLLLPSHVFSIRSPRRQCNILVTTVCLRLYIKQVSFHSLFVPLSPFLVP